MGETKAALTSELDTRLGNLRNHVTKSLADYEPLQAWANSTGDPQYARNYELVQVAKAPDDTQNGHAGRWFYKINFNPNNPGFWYPNREEMRNACTALSKDLKAQKCPGEDDKTDGIDRNLKP